MSVNEGVKESIKSYGTLNNLTSQTEQQPIPTHQQRTTIECDVPLVIIGICLLIIGLFLACDYHPSGM